ncbi:hypothetical protein C5C18_10275 [Rathayibacter tritici]|uniref:hypothetical protein n=1 Tax=Rathayibacter tritici TaxID=33888 RepID=UPI00082B285D|nr:hypothetical protein [Rathayibacter tritici]PPF30507.1 hypothetical protein C5C06_05265 [Rathayibacter tritici]PPF66981.1 hypothetical protein C5C21_07995 [Rathayibacter tritici]PPG06416.1 hypothetical protein C5C18_10275 [Rathayibacter tritici]PPI16608.1 hypothetical protein C5D07_06195 [Rathayibacter tritici]PPI45441.1 hypothetical protein C5D18_06410 [Rathayibacter tritici]
MNTFALKAATAVAISASAITYSPASAKFSDLYPTQDAARGPFASGAMSSGSKLGMSVRAATNKAVDTHGSQGYYWTAAWQREEGIALRELRSGEYQDFESAEDLIAWLNEPDE